MITDKPSILKAGGLCAAALTLSGPVYSGAANPAQTSPDRPNVVLIVGDDVGYGDLGCYGYDNLVPTPNLDRLAADGVRFTQAYVTAPVCGPTRYALLSGAYQQRFGVLWNVDCWAKIPGIDLEETPQHHRLHQELLHETLKSSGYVTGLVGHYGLPCYPETTFDETWSVIHYMAHYWPDENGHYPGVNEPVAISPKKRVLWGPEREGDEYLTDRLGRQAVDFIDRHKSEPFFLKLAFNAPHSPMMAKKSHQSAVAHLKSEALKFYGAMLLSMDENIGKVLDALDENGLSENTLVIFFSDNGPSYAFNEDWPEDWPKEVMGSAGPLRGYKGQFWEGGIRIPYIIKWPGRISEGQVYKKTISSLDIYPTVCNAVHADVPSTVKLDGVDLMPYLQGKNNGTPHDILYWYAGKRGGAVREGKWKLYADRNETRLFDLEKDIGETTDLSNEHPEIKKQLEDKYQAFIAKMPPPINPQR